ncbi:hypothetical protein ASG48_11270 [Aurantimonas sp. Leaf443]|nr:hypothetical protein ASG48_11270 [Aurantimonas sp. Leaf443]
MRQRREFQRARRHSRLVGAMKIGLPLVAVVIVVGGIAATWLARALPGDVSLSGATIRDGQVVMQDPRMSGIDSRNRPYELVARQATQALNGSGITLDGVSARVNIDDDTKADIVAASGFYDPKTESLNLTRDITVDTTSGVSIALQGARIDIRNGAMAGTGPVLIETARQTISSGSVDIEAGGKVISFGGGVKMILHPEDTDRPQKQALKSE